jgi:hypothetical protein
MDSKDHDAIERSLLFYRKMTSFAAGGEFDLKGLQADIKEFNERVLESDRHYILHPFLAGERIVRIDHEDVRVYKTKKGCPFVLTVETLSGQGAASLKGSLLSESRREVFRGREQGFSVMFKQEEGIVREALVLNFMLTFRQMLEGLGIILWPYRVYPLDIDKGLVEYIEGAMSIDEIKRQE